LNLTDLGIGPAATLFMYSREREIVEELGSFAMDCFHRSSIRIVNRQDLVNSISRLALARVAGVDPDRMRRCNVKVVWLEDGADLPEAARFVEHKVDLFTGKPV
jgi:hypothetical protein